MFDLSNISTLNLDQLHPWQVYILRSAVRDDSGREHPAGAKVSFEKAIVDVYKGNAEIHLLDAHNHPFVVRTQSNAHRQLFERTEEQTRPLKSELTKADISRLPEESHDWPTWLAQQPDFAEAAAILNGKRRGGWGGALSDAEELLGAAKHYATAHPGLARWLADHALNHFYSWTSQATSGGEGTAMQNQIREQLKTAERLAGRS